ncbi:MAG: hypothetical protein KGH94_04205 [Candidatus Micrarchaeota archaeon]|nr:hypothetical protein [Candidatus Micrarchaeota archaeon]
MAARKLKRYGLEGGAKVLITIGLLFNLITWLLAAYYFGLGGNRFNLFVVPFIFTCVSSILLLVVRYRYTLFEEYPYLMNLPSIFYRIGDGKDGGSKRSMAFSMIFTVHALVIAMVGLMGLVLTFAIASSIKSNTASPFLYAYLVIAAILIVSVLLQYRRIYIRFVK